MIKSEIASLSPVTAEKILAVVNEIERKLELASPGEPIVIEFEKEYVGDTDYYNITDNSGKRAVLAKMEEWKIITVEDNDDSSYLVFTTLDKIRNFKLLLPRSPEPAISMGKFQLLFYPDDGNAVYRGNTYQFSGQTKGLLTFFNDHKNIPYTANELIVECNPFISNPSKHFKIEKQIKDAVRLIRKHLKVGNREFFPIQKANGKWSWIEK